MVAGPGIVGTAVAHAGFFGIDFLFGDDDKKSDMHHPRPGADAGAQSSRKTAGIAAAEAPTAKVGSLPENVGAPETAGARSFAGVPENVVIAEGLGGGGGGGISRTNSAVRARNLPRVSSAPVTRSVVIRGIPRTASPAGTPAPAFAPPSVPQAPVVAPLAAPPPVSPEPEGRPAPAAPPAPSPSTSQAKDPLAHSNTGVPSIPDSYRAGYAEYLRSATTTDLLVEALPGVAGIAGFTLIGAYAGYRQAKGLRRALLAPAPTTILL